MKSHDVIEMPVSQLAAGRASYNPRHLSKAGKERLSASLETFGLVQPLVWNRRSETLVAGHQRLDILEDRGVDRVHVVAVDLDPQQERLLNITLNRQDFGQFNREALDQLLGEIAAESKDLLESLHVDEMPEFKTSSLENLVAKIQSEPEWSPGPRDVDPDTLAENLASKIRSLPPSRLATAALIAVSAGSREILILVNDPALSDFASEIRTAIEAGNGAPLTQIFERFV